MPLTKLDATAALGVEAELWEHATNAFLANNSEVPACSSGDSFATGSEQFVHLQRIVNFCERNYHRALKESPSQSGPGAVVCQRAC